MDTIKLFVVFMTVTIISCNSVEDAPHGDSEDPPVEDGGDSGSRADTESDTEFDTESDNGEPIPRAAGYINLQPRDIGYTNRSDEERVTGTTNEANIFYAFVPADTEPEEMPLMVMLNGGPSATTIGHLFAFGTAPYLVDRDDPGELIKENPSSFSAIANLLYIDTRQVGFSYELAPVPEEAVLREFTDDIVSFNLFTDVSDILLTMLAVMEAHPFLMDNPVVLLGESYGGARIGLMYGLMSETSALFDSDATYYDPTLGEALKRHFAQSIPGSAFEDLTLSDIKEQFGWQILLQPGRMLPNAGDYMYNARCDDMPQSDPRYDLCNSPTKGEFDLRFPREELDEMGFIAGSAFLHPPSFERVFGVSPETVEGLSASDRERAFRDIPAYRTGNPSAEWMESMGALTAADYYFIPIVPTSNAGRDDGFMTSAFVNSLVWVNTFISNGYYDYAVASDKIPGALENANQFLQTPLVASAVLDTASPADEERPGEMTVVFTEAMGLGEDAAVTVRMPIYDDSGHSIALRQASELRDDIRSFLEERGAYRREKE